MIRRVVAVALAAGMAFALYADGDSGDALRTPERYKDNEIVENTSKTLTLKSKDCVKKPDERGGWLDDGEKSCYARHDGVGLPTKEAGALKKTFDAPEVITYLAITVSASGKTVADNPELSLTLKVRDDLAPETRIFSVDGVSVPKTLLFTFKEGVEAEYIRLSNPNPSSVFEVERVVWKRLAPAIEGELSAPKSVMAGKTVRCALGSLSGGSGTYVRARFDFAGQSVVQEPVIPGLSVAFVAPPEDGDYPLTVTVEDDLGATVTLSATIHVTAYTPPRNLRATDVARTGFTLEWDRPTLSPEEYHVTVRAPAADTSHSARFRPEWVADGEGRFITKEPIWPLESWPSGMNGVVILGLPGWSGKTLEWSADGATWKPVSWIVESWRITRPLGNEGKLWLRTADATPPASVRVSQFVDRVYERLVKEADGQRCVATFDGLPAGHPVEATVSACYATPGGGELLVESAPLSVRLQPIPAFTEGSWDGTCATLAWPEGSEGLEAEMIVHAEREVPHALPPGLYLTRTCYTASKDADGKVSGFKSGKGIVLTNTTAQDIPLDGAYTLRSVKTGSNKETVWNFNATPEGEKPYAHVVPAHGELAFSHGTRTIPDVRDGVVTVSSGVLYNLTPDYTLTLMKGDIAINSMGCATNVVRRLEEDSLEAYTDHPLHADSLNMDSFYDAWTTLFEAEIHSVLGFSPIPGSHQSQLFVNPKDLVQDFESLRRIWADFVIRDGSFRSKPLTLELWRREEPKPATGRGLILHLR